LADFDAFGFPSTFAAALFSPADGDLLIPRPDRWLEATATRFDCCLSQPISDGVKGWLTTKELPFDVREAVEAMAELLAPETFECFAMAFP
jgi:hypothetical protein